MKKLSILLAVIFTLGIVSLASAKGGHGGHGKSSGHKASHKTTYVPRRKSL